MPHTRPPRIDGRPPAERRSDVPARALAAASVDTLGWSHPNLPWRLRFRSPIEIEPGLTIAQVYTRGEEIATTLARHCTGTVRPGSFGLYIERDGDVARLLELYGNFIVRLQHKSQYDAAHALAERLGAAWNGTTMA